MGLRNEQRSSSRAQREPALSAAEGDLPNELQEPAEQVPRFARDEEYPPLPALPIANSQ